MIERVPNPRPLEAALKELRHLCRERSRRTRGSRRYAETSRKITRLQRRVADIRGCHVHRLTTRLAKTHGEIVVEGLDAAGMLRQKGLPGARARRRGLSDSALGETRRQLGYKSGWYGSRLVIAKTRYERNISMSNPRRYQPYNHLLLKGGKLNCLLDAVGMTALDLMRTGVEVSTV